MSRTRSVLIAVTIVGLALLGSLWLRSGEGPGGPEGVWLLGDGDSVRQGLRQLVQLEPAPIAGLASVVDRLGDCDRIVAHLPALPSFEFPQPEAETGDLGLVDVFESLRCATTDDTLPDFARRPEETDASEVVLAVSGAGIEIVAELLDGPGVRWQIKARTRSTGHPLLVAAESPSAPVLDGRRALAHLQFAVDGGLDPAALRPQEGGGGHVFNLRGDALGKLVLGTTWELTLLPPADRDAVPPLVLALEVTSAGLATTAMEALLDEGREVWSWAPPVPARLGDAEGQCLEDLRLLPSMAPCWVIVERQGASHLVLGWNRQVVGQALSGHAPQSGSEVSSWAWVDLDRLTRPWSPQGAGGPTEVEADARWPWHRLEVDGQRVDGVYTYQLSLAPRSAAP